MTGRNIYKFDGQLNAAFDRMVKEGWRIDAGKTSNCTDHYDVEGVAITTTNHVALILSSNYQGFKYLVPCDFTELNGELVCLGNYGTPTRGDDYQDALKNFNKSYAPENCNYNLCQIRPFTKVIWKDGSEWETTKHLPSLYGVEIVHIHDCKNVRYEHHYQRTDDGKDFVDTMGTRDKITENELLTVISQCSVERVSYTAVPDMLVVSPHDDNAKIGLVSADTGHDCKIVGDRVIRVYPDLELLEPFNLYNSTLYDVYSIITFPYNVDDYYDFDIEVLVCLSVGVSADAVRTMVRERSR